MLPSFRTIAATFLCGFIFVFASLQMATTLNSKHLALPVTTARAAPAPVVIASDWPSIPAAMPVLYDLRFVASATTPTPAGLQLQQIDRLAPIPVPAVARDVRLEPASTPVAADVKPIEASDIVATISMAPPSTQPAELPQPAEPPQISETSANSKTQPATIAAIESPLATSPDDPVTETPITPPSETTKPDGMAIAPSPPVEVASLTSTATAAEIETPDSQTAAPVAATIVLPKPRPAGDVLQAKRKSATKRRTRRTQKTAQDDPFNNRPPGGRFNDWQWQNR